MRLKGFVSKPELQKLNRNSMYVFINQRLVRDRLLQHALSEAYRNVIPPTTFPVVLLFFELPPAEVDVNVHPAKTEVRFRQSSVVHDFVRDTVREALRAARPAASFLDALETRAQASSALTPTLTPEIDSDAGVVESSSLTMSDAERWELSERAVAARRKCGCRLRPGAAGSGAGAVSQEAVATGELAESNVIGESKWGLRLRRRSIAAVRWRTRSCVQAREQSGAR